MKPVIQVPGTELSRRAPAGILSDDSDFDGRDGESAQGGGNLFASLHGLLRGRYPLAISLAIIFSVAGAAVAWTMTPTRYQSNGLLVINASIEPILNPGDKNLPVQNIDSYISSQAALLESQRVIDMAMHNPEWLELHRGTSAKDLAQFTRQLEVEHPAHSEMLRVAFTDADPNAAMVTVRSLIRAYMKLYGDSMDERDANRMQVLEERRTALTNENKAIHGRIESIAQEYGSASLDSRYSFEQQQENLFDAELRKVQLVRAASDAHSTRPGTPAETVSTPSDIARVDPEMANLLSRKREAESNITQLQLKYGPDHPLLISARSSLGTIQTDIDRLVHVYSQPLRPNLGGGEGQNLSPFGSPEALAAHETNLRKLRDETHKDVVELGRKILQIQSLQGDAENVRTSLAETKTRIEHLQIEAMARGRIQLISEGDRPLEPFNDKRPALTAASGVGGAVFGIGMLALVGFVGQRVRHAEDIGPGQHQKLRLLGMLPQLRDDFSDHEQVITAAHRIHHIRAMLQVRATTEDAPIFAVTSPSPGAGKTSLTVALGASFAASGSATLLIDCDLIGGGLSARTDAHRRVGEILRDRKIITQEQLEEAVTEVRKLKTPFCSYLRAKGWIKGPDVDTAMAVEARSHMGLLDALAGVPLEECVQETGIAKLFVLPLHVAGARHVGQLSPKALRRLFAKARTLFDAVIVDTGPVIGCPEATMVCGEADEVLLTLSRGEQRPLVERSIESLGMAEARLAGVVFNRANVRDIKRSGYTSTARSRIDTEIVPVATPTQRFDDTRSIFRLGPLGAAVVSETAAISGKYNAHANGNGNGNGNATEEDVW